MVSVFRALKIKKVPYFLPEKTLSRSFMHTDPGLAIVSSNQTRGDNLALRTKLQEPE